jgi:tetratricopeptide (TPR) repeat protein
MPHIGLALSGQGKYAEAKAVFAEAIRYSRQFEIWSMMARALVMSSSCHFDVYDFAGHKAVVQEGHELARANNVQQAIVSGHIDLLFNHVALGDVGGAEAILSAVAETVANAAGNHGWLWRLRLAQAEAELALARGDWEEALRLADVSISHSQPRGRVKYHTFGLGTRASALAALGRKREAIATARLGLNLIRPIGAPALFVRAAAGLLALEGDDSVLAEARGAVEHISSALTSDTMCRSFLAAEPVELVMKWSSAR